MKTTILNTIPLSVILEEIMGAMYIENESKWKLENGDNIQVVKENWYNWGCKKGGSNTVSLIKHWIELSNDIQNTLNALQEIYSKYEKIILKEELDETLKNNKVQSPRVKI